MNDTRDGRLVTVFGASGFVGGVLARTLAKRGWRVRAAVRRPDLAFHLQPLGGVGQVTAVQANLRYPDSVAAALRGADAAVNLVGIMNARGRQTFEAVQAYGAEAVARCCAAAGISNLVHMSAIGADPASDSDYARSKGEGEAAVVAALPGAVIMRPSVIFGPGDDFFNRFGALARFLPVLPVIGGETKLQPVYVGDVAEAFARALEGGAKPGAAYELGGPDVMTIRQIMDYVQSVTGRSRTLVPMPEAGARVMAKITDFLDRVSLGLMPDELVTTPDQIKLLGRDNVVSAQAQAEGRTLEGLGIRPTLVEAIAPTYLYRFRKTGQFVRDAA